MLIVSCVTVSNVVTDLALASNARCAMISWDDRFCSVQEHFEVSSGVTLKRFPPLAADFARFERNEMRESIIVPFPSGHKLPPALYFFHDVYRELTH